MRHVSRVSHPNMHRLCLFFFWSALVSASLPTDYLMPDPALAAPTFRFPDPHLTHDATVSPTKEENHLGLDLGPPASWLDEPPFVRHRVDIATGLSLAPDATRDAKLDQQFQHLLKHMDPIHPSRISFAKPIASSHPLPPSLHRTSPPSSLAAPSSPPTLTQYIEGKEPVRGRDVPINFNDDEDKAKPQKRPSLRRKGSSASSLHSIASSVSGKIKRSVLKRTKSDSKRDEGHDHIHPTKEGNPCSVCDQRQRDALRAEAIRMNSLIIPTAVWRSDPPSLYTQGGTAPLDDASPPSTVEDRPFTADSCAREEGNKMRKSVVHPSGGTEEFIAWQRHIVNNLDAVAGRHSPSTPRTTLPPSPLSGPFVKPSSRPSYVAPEERPSSDQLLDPTYHAIFGSDSPRTPVPPPRRPVTSTNDPEMMLPTYAEQAVDAPPQRFSQIFAPSHISIAAEMTPPQRPKPKKSLRSLFQRNKASAVTIPNPTVSQGLP